MKFLLNLLHLLIGMSIILIPVWIIGLGDMSLPRIAKRLIIVAMVVIASIVSVSGILKPATNMMAGSIANLIFLIYLASVYIAAYKIWSH